MKKMEAGWLQGCPEFSVRSLEPVENILYSLLSIDSIEWNI